MERSNVTRLSLRRAGPSGGRAAVVTGASRGIGYAIAGALLRENMRVAICARDGERLAQAAKSLATHGAVYADAVDLARAAEVERFIKRAAGKLGPIEVLVNNAGRAWYGEFHAQPIESIDQIVDTNVKGLMYATRYVLAAMAQQPARGAIVNIASGAGLSGVPGIAVYSASKSAVVGFTQALAGELRGRGIRVYAVCPGRVATDMQQEYSGRRTGMPPERVADAVLRLIDPNTGARSGTCLEL